MTMKALMVAGCFVVALTAANAQPVAPPFVPFTVTEQDAKAFSDWLGEQPIPRKYTDQIVNWLAQLEQRAVNEKRTADAKAAAEGDKK